MMRGASRSVGLIGGLVAGSFTLRPAFIYFLSATKYLRFFASSIPDLRQSLYRRA
jgi:hypothetical protein